jgi:hypothetical protein
MLEPPRYSRSTSSQYAILKRPESTNITGLELIGRVREKAIKDHVILVEKLHQLKRLICTKSVVDQDSGLLPCSSFRQRVKNMLNLIEAYHYVSVATIRVAEMPT